jgi:hypothetical protein
MTFLEATNTIETALTALGMRDIFNQPVAGIIVAGYVQKYFETEWEENTQALLTKTRTIEDYLARALELIDETARIIQRRKVENKLADIYRMGEPA